MPYRPRSTSALVQRPSFLSASLGISIDEFALPTDISTLTWNTKVADILPKRLVDYGSSGKSKGQSDRYSYTPVWCRKVNIFIYISPRIYNAYYLTFFASQS